MMATTGGMLSVSALGMLVAFGPCWAGHHAGGIVGQVHDICWQGQMRNLGFRLDKV